MGDISRGRARTPLSVERLAQIQRVSGQFLAIRSSVPPGPKPDAVETNPERIGMLLEALTRTGHRFSLRPWPEGDGPEARGAVSFALETRAAYADYRFLLRMRGESVELVRLERHGTRASPRYPAPPTVDLVFQPPLRPGEMVSRRVLFVSRDEIVCEADPESDGFIPGLAIPEVCLRWKGGELRFAGTVLATGVCDGSTATIALTPFDDHTAGWWQEELDGVAHPNTAVGTSAPEELWELFADSGYFNISDKSTADFLDLHGAFVVASRKLALAPHLGGQVDWRSRHGIDCSVTLLRAWHEASLVYHVARRRERPLALSGNRSLYEVYHHALEHASRDPLLRWLVVYIKTDGARFTRLLHKDFPSWHDDGQRASLVRFRAMAGRTDAAAEADDEPSWDVAPAEAPELDLLARRIAHLRTPAYVEALDLTRRRLKSPALERAWSRAGLARKREILIARREGQPVAAAVLDLAEDGLHLFGLLDVVRVFPLVEGAEAAYEPLLRAAARWYAARGKATFTYFDEWFDGTAQRLGLEDLGEAWLTVTRTDLLPELFETLLVATAPERAGAHGWP
ncbi:MAG: hypothetical protein ACOC97_00790 [Myxococcota bacterium]